MSEDNQYIADECMAIVLLNFTGGEEQQKEKNAREKKINM